MRILYAETYQILQRQQKMDLTIKHLIKKWQENRAILNAREENKWSVISKCFSYVS